LRTDKQARVSSGFGAGVGAALVMMGVMAVLRFTIHAVTIPELIERSLVSVVGDRLVFFFTDRLGDAGRVLLLLIIAEGTLLLRGLLGLAFVRLWPVQGRILGRKWVSGLLYGLIIGALYNAALLPQVMGTSTPQNATGPISDSPFAAFGVPIWVTVFLVNIGFGLALVAMVRWPRAAVASPVAAARLSTSLITRRDFARVVTGGAVTLLWGVPFWYDSRGKSARSRVSLTARAADAARTNGWRHLGTLNGAAPSRANFRESDVLYNPDDLMYYVFSTEGDGNPAPPTEIVASTAATPTTITARGHRLRVGMQVSIKGHLNDRDDTTSALNNHNSLPYYKVSAINIGGDPDTFQLVSFDGARPVGSTGGYGGLVNYPADPHIAMRRATAPEAITQASGNDYIEYIISGIWYPTIIKEGSAGSSTWHLWGTKGASRIGHSILVGDRPGPSRWPESFTLNPPLPLGDISIRKNPEDGYWYAVGLFDGSTNDIRIYRTNEIVTSNNWEPVGVVFADGHPSWASNYLPDPNICFSGGKAYVLFTGGQELGKWNTGIVEVDLVTGKAKGTPEILLQYGAYPRWMNSPLSDLVFVPSGHDGVDRIFGFGSVPYLSGQNAIWACLDLPG
jgi:hypothetical protein